MRSLSISYAYVFVLVCGSLVALGAPLFAHAQFHWSQYGLKSSEKSAISKLPSSRVEIFPIPVLFGVGVDDLTRNFGDPRGGGTRIHEGLDMIVPDGTPIVSPTRAVVTKTGTGASAGIYVYTANPGGETFGYLHLSQIGEGVVRGKVLEPGDLIGYVGDTGNARGGAPHLHFETRLGHAQDPFHRLGREFTPEEKMAAVNNILSLRSNPSVYASWLVENFGGEFKGALTAGVPLHPLILSALNGNSAPGLDTPAPTASVSPTPPPSALTGGIVSRDLEVGEDGSDVAWLQKYIIAADKGEDARYLGRSGATGYFGPITRRALAEFQNAVGISPASGYYGPITRTFIAQGNSKVVTSNNHDHERVEDQSEVVPDRIAIDLFARDLERGMKGEDVRILQSFLNAQGFTVADAGDGSLGNETTYFGPATQSALIRFQKAHAIFPSVGYLGSVTRTHIEDILF